MCFIVVRASGRFDRFRVKNLKTEQIRRGEYLNHSWQLIASDWSSGDLWGWWFLQAVLHSWEQVIKNKQQNWKANWEQVKKKSKSKYKQHETIFDCRTT